MSRYVKKADRVAIETKTKLQVGLQAIADDPNSTRNERLGALSKLADLQIADQRVEARTGPLKAEIAEQQKALRDLRAELATANKQLDSTQGRVAELETETSDLTTERAGLKSDVSRLGISLSNSHDEVNAAHAQARSVQQKLTDTSKRVDALALNLRSLLSGFKRHYIISEIADSFVVELLFELGDSADRDLFIALGWPEVKFDFWRGWLKKGNRLPTDTIIDLLHRSDCSCTGHEPETRIKDEGVMRPLTDDDRNFLLAWLKHRGVDADLQIGKLQAEHRKDWTDRNTPELRLTPPVSHREIVPFGTRVVSWGED